MQEERRNRRIWPAALTGSIAILLALVWTLRSKREDFVYEGKRLSQHLFLAYAGISVTGRGPRVGEPEVTAAPKINALVLAMQAAHARVSTISTNALPLLTTWLATDLPPWRLKVGQFLCSKGIFSSAFPPEDLRIIACRAVGALNADALPLAIQVAAVCTNSSDRVANEAIDTISVLFRDLERIAPVAVEPLSAAIDRSIKVLELRAVHDLSRRSRLESLRAARARADMILRLNTENPQEQAKILRVLSRRNEFFQHARPLLLAHLASAEPALAENAAICLRNYGANATSVLTDLQRALAHHDERVRKEASKAIERITALARDK
jgi:hypothetical protein